ncbi:MAG: hypothetical protein IT435_20410 [Phycisphaerales bacterium]|nr:hypothetical protein [Phycisphaerales bacterium]
MGATAAVSYFLWLMVLVFLAFVGARHIYITITPPRRASKVAACEMCGYAVAGLPTLACPECSTDLRTTGIITLPMEMRRRGGLFGAICHWTLVWLMIGAVAISVTMRLYVAGRWSPPSTTAIYTFTPRSGAFANVTATVTDTQTTRAIHLEMKLLDEARTGLP